MNQHDSSPHPGDKQALIAQRQWAHYVRARDNGHSEYVAMAKKCDAFYQGEQWADADRKKLENEGRPAMTFNLILSTINAALGEQANREMQVSFLPTRDGTRDGAIVLGKLTQAIMQANNYHFLENFVFSDGVIQDRGYFDVRISFEDNLGGDVKITHLDPLTVMIDPEAKDYDPETWNEVMVTSWMSLDEIATKYGQAKADQLHSQIRSGDHYSYDSVQFGTNRFGGENFNADRVYGYELPEEKNIKSVRIIERQHYQWVKELVLVDPETGDLREAPQHRKPEEVYALAEKHGIQVMERAGPRVRWTVTADHVVLYDDWSLYRTLTIVPYFPYFRRGKPFGMVRNLLNPQEFYNKSRSQELHIVNTTANSGWITEEGSLVNMTEDELTERGAESGLHLVYARSSQPPMKIQPNNVPPGLAHISDTTAMSIQQISGMNDGMLGQVSPEVSGVALDRKTQRGQVQMGQPFKHLAFSRKLVGRKILELIQDFYTEQRTVTVLNPDDKDNPEEQVTINQINEVGEIINSVGGGRYDIAITSLPTRDNADEDEFAKLMDMRANGIAVPDDAIIRRSNLTDRDRLADTVQKLLGRAEPTDEEVQMQQQLQQIEMQRMQAEQMRASAAKDLANAEKTAGGDRSPEMELEYQRIEAQIRLKQQELETRMRLAQITAQTRAQESQLRTAADMARTKFQGETQLAAARSNTDRNAGTQPAQADKKDQ